MYLFRTPQGSSYFTAVYAYSRNNLVIRLVNESHPFVRLTWYESTCSRFVHGNIIFNRGLLRLAEKVSMDATILDTYVRVYIGKTINAS